MRKTIKKYIPVYVIFLMIFIGITFPFFVGGFATESFKIGDISIGLLAIGFIILAEPLFIAIAVANAAQFLTALEQES